MRSTTRRGFLGSAVVSTLGLLLRAPGRHVAEPPVRAITRGPRNHWFGYYDKLQFDPGGRRVLGMQVDFEHRSPRPDDEIRIGVVDLEVADRWVELGTSRAWGWQQGCMLQWVPGSRSRLLWNDRSGDQFVCRVHDLDTGEQTKIPTPIYALHPDGRRAVTVDFGRLEDCRPGYGYSGVPDARAEQAAPEDAGIWIVDLESGEARMIVSLRQVLDVGVVEADERESKHWFNHLLFNPDGSRFVFLHRWRPPGQKWWRTRMLSATPDGDDIAVVDPSGHTSHFIWRDAEHLLVWTRPAGQPDGFYLLRDRSDEIRPVGAGIMTRNGHCTYLPGNEWILNDTYPDRDRLQHAYLYHVESERVVTLGRFQSPAAYRGEWRCDLHPRFSPDGRKVVIDSTHDGTGRQMYLIDIGEIVGG